MLKFFDRTVLLAYGNRTQMTISVDLLNMVAYLTILHDPKPPGLIGIEEPEKMSGDFEILHFWKYFSAITTGF